MADFSQIVAKTFNFEGGYQADKDDSANWTRDAKNNKVALIGTNHGISAVTLQTYLGRYPTVAEMKALTVEDAKKIYKKLFWDKIYGDDIKSQSVAHIIFDAFIASGYNGLLRVRLAINKVSGSKVVNEAAKAFNTDVVKIINNLNPEKLFETIKQGEIEQRKRLVKQKPELQKFLNGWLNRLNQIVYTDGAVIGLVFVGLLLITLSVFLIYKSQMA